MSLFHQLLNRFTHSPQEQLAQQVSNNRFMEKFDHYSHLIRLQDARQLLEVIIPGQRNSFQSMVMGIDFVNTTFCLDEFSPASLSPESLINKTVTVRHQRHWDKLEIQTTIEDWCEIDNAFHLTLPESLEYQPRRNSVRVLLPPKTSLQSCINPLYGAPWYARVKDISQGGMRVTLPGDLRAHLHKDKVLPKCRVMLDESMSIQSRGVVKAFTYAGKPYRHTDVSIEFCHMSSSHQTHLQHFIEYAKAAT